mmetsp:Transcript_25165/g.58954  ORF Transcript_25165/g.58954 Transcript_25165/m.58954 type:complete len:228 (+) Transcript_25165:410-1093(+)
MVRITSVQRDTRIQIPINIIHRQNTRLSTQRVPIHIRIENIIHPRIIQLCTRQVPSHSPTLITDHPRCIQRGQIRTDMKESILIDMKESILTWTHTPTSTNVPMRIGMIKITTTITIHSLPITMITMRIMNMATKTTKSIMNHSLPPRSFPLLRDQPRIRLREALHQLRDRHQIPPRGQLQAQRPVPQYGRDLLTTAMVRKFHTSPRRTIMLRLQFLIPLVRLRRVT